MLSHLAFPTYQRCDLQRIAKTVIVCSFLLKMLSAIIYDSVATRHALYTSTDGTPLAATDQSSRTRSTLTNRFKVLQDRDRPVSRRSKPNSRAVLVDEQSNPWELLHPQDTASRHRGHEPLRRYELSGATMLLSPAYL